MNLGEYDVGAAISAAGTTQATATYLINAVSLVTTAAASSGVRLRLHSDAPGYQGAPQIVFNGGANPVNVYPPTGVKINNLPTNSPHILAVNTACLFVTVSPTQIIAILSA